MKSINSKDVQFYSPLINDYINGELKKKNIISWEYSEEQLINNTKNRRFSKEDRSVLVSAIQSQYQDLDLTESELNSIDLLGKNTTFTITTGHQLSLIGGPQFFYTKILDVINLAKKLSIKHEVNFVPVFWMATEDHDYEEISSVNLFGKKINCPGENKGPVGRISSSYFNDFLKEVNSVLGDGEIYAQIKSLINSSFNTSKTLAQATRIFVRGLFADKGLVIVDGDDTQLKNRARNIFESELCNKVAFHSVSAQIEKLQGYKIQVNPREINLFYMEDSIRQRILKNDFGYSTVDNNYNWTNSEMKELISASPDKISPNVLIRPLYQEVVLPNVAYMGGAGEIAYWLELEGMFKAFNVDFPIPIVRTSYFSASNKSICWLKELGVEFSDLFGNNDLLRNNVALKISDVEINFQEEENGLNELYAKLLEKALKIDSNLEKVILGEKKRAISALNNVEKRFVNAEKKKHEQTLNKLDNSIQKLFPNGSPMERVDSFIPLLANPNFEFIPVMDVFKGEICLIEY